MSRNLSVLETKQLPKQGILLKYSSSMLIDKNVRRSCNVGYLFLQDIYYSLGIHKICDSISDKYKFDYDLNGILSMLVYGIFSRSVASVRCRLLPFPSFLSAISGKHPGVGEILPASNALVHYLVDFPYLPLFRLVKGVVQGFFPNFCGGRYCLSGWL